MQSDDNAHGFVLLWRKLLRRDSLGLPGYLRADPAHRSYDLVAAAHRQHQCGVAYCDIGQISLVKVGLGPNRGSVDEFDQLGPPDDELAFIGRATPNLAADRAFDYTLRKFRKLPYFRIDHPIDGFDVRPKSCLLDLKNADASRQIVCPRLLKGGVGIDEEAGTEGRPAIGHTGHRRRLRLDGLATGNRGVTGPFEIDARRELFGVQGGRDLILGLLPPTRSLINRQLRLSFLDSPGEIVLFECELLFERRLLAITVPSLG